MAHMLIVHNDDNLRATLQSVLEAIGYSVVALEHAAAGLAHLRTCGDCLAVLMGDQLAVEHGRTLLETVLRHPTLPHHGRYLLLTPTPERLAPAARTELDALGIQVVVMPFELDDLLVAVERAMGIPTSTPLRSASR